MNLYATGILVFSILLKQLHICTLHALATTPRDANNVSLPFDSIIQKKLAWKYNTTVSDYVRMDPPEGSRAAIPEGVSVWPKNGVTDTYDIPLELTGVSVTTWKRVRYVTSYLSRATKLNFRQAVSTDIPYVKVLERPDQLCWSTLGRPAGHPIIYMNLHPAVCTTLHMVMHEFLHLLGFMHEHERQEASQHYINLRANTYAESYGTAYDVLSVMSYPHAAIGPTRDPYLNELSKHRRTFLTRCDWNLLLTLYPSENPPPTCVPNFIPRLLVPTQKLLAIHNRDRAEFLCRYSNEWLYDAQYCVPPNFSAFPSLSHELGYHAVEYHPFAFGSTHESSSYTNPTTTYGYHTRTMTTTTAYALPADELDNTTMRDAIQKALNITNYPIGQLACEHITSHIRNMTFIENCGPEAEALCHKVKSLDELRKWMHSYYVQCKRQDNETNVTSSTIITTNTGNQKSFSKPLQYARKKNVHHTKK